MNEQNEADRKVLARLEKFSTEELASFDDWQPTDLAHYVGEQKPWLEDEIYFLGMALGRSPSEAEIAECVLAARESVRFRAFYVLRYPHRVRLNRPTFRGRRECLAVC
ncbi:MAG: hypothetical protein ACLFR7_00215 [Opitutales bacterium]